MNSRNHRQKLSTTVSGESYDYLRQLVRSGRARSLAEAVDYAVARVREVENRRRLEESTAAYFARLHAKKTGRSRGRAAAEEKALGAALAGVIDEVDFAE